VDENDWKKSIEFGVVFYRSFKKKSLKYVKRFLNCGAREIRTHFQI
jgi:hypothetical protein